MMKRTLFIFMLVLFSTLAVAGSTSVGDGFVGYSAISVTSMDGMIGSDTSVATDAVVIDSDNYTILMTTLDANKTGIGVIYTTGLGCSHTTTHYAFDEVGWRISA